MELMASDEGIPTVPQNGWSRASPDRLIQKIDAHGMTDKLPGSGRPKSVRITDVAVVQDLICSQDDVRRFKDKSKNVCWPHFFGTMLYTQ